MFKWILILTIAFLSAWLFAKQHVPQSVRSSTFGQMLDITLFPLEYNLKHSKFKEGKFGASVLELDDKKLTSILKAVEGKQKQTVIYLYNSECFLCRMVLGDINKLAQQYTSAGVLFLVISFDPDVTKNKMLLNLQDRLYFRPFRTAPQNIKVAEYFYARYEIGFREPPVVLFRDSQGFYKNIGVDHETSSRVQSMIKVTK